MNVYTIYADVKEGIDARTFVANMKLFLDKLPTMHAYRITRMKLGFRSMDLPSLESIWNLKACKHLMML